MKRPVIEFENYSYQYRSQKEPTVKDINLTIYEGERVIIVGPSGCGKSTLAHCLNGLNPFSYSGKCTGSLKIFGHDTRDLGIFGLSQYVGTVLQDTDGQFIGMTVMEDIAFAMENDLVGLEELKERTLEEAKKVHLLEKIESAPHALSGGQKQRVSLAGVLVNRVPILLFDEPLANLDPATGKEAIELIDEIQKKTNTTVVIIEHRLEDALWMGADRIILMEKGGITVDAPVNRLLSHDYLKKAGIRESLYITALKYASVELNEEMNLTRAKYLSLTEEQKEQIRHWFHEIKIEGKKKRKKELLRVENISFGYEEGKPTISEINFSVKKGEIISIVGKNGAGKSTLAKLLCGFEKQHKGKIYLDGRDISEDGIKKRASFIGYVMQNPNQMITKPLLFDEVALALRQAGVSEKETEERVHRILKICGLYQFRNWPISALSYGQKKRVTIAGILVQDPQIIILDEPTAGQDYRHYTEIMRFLSSLNERGITIIMITHDMHLMLEYTDRCLVFAEGSLIADMVPEELFSDEELLRKANLKETSLFTLAQICGLPEKEFIRTFIDKERQTEGKEREQ